MQKIKVLIVEDEWIVSEEIKELLLQAGYDVVGQAEHADDALNLLNSNHTDVVLMDINIKGNVDGIELANKINEQFRVAIIFLTAFDDQKIVDRAKFTRPSAYIVKPFDTRNLQLAVEMAFNNLTESDMPPEQDSYIISDIIFIKEGSRFKRISVADIQYAQAVGSYTDVVTVKGKSTLTTNLKLFEKNLNHSGFLRVHRSFLINLSYAEELEGNRVYIGGVPIPISSTYKSEFLRRFKFI